MTSFYLIWIGIGSKLVGSSAATNAALASRNEAGSGTVATAAGGMAVYRCSSREACSA